MLQGWSLGLDQDRQDVTEGVHCDEDHLRQDEDHHHPGADHLRQGEDHLGADPLLDTVDQEDPAGRHVVDRQDEQAHRLGDGVVLLSGILREEGGATVRLQGGPLVVRPDRHFDHVDFLGLDLHPEASALLSQGQSQGHDQGISQTDTDDAIARVRLIEALLLL